MKKVTDVEKEITHPLEQVFDIEVWKEYKMEELLKRLVAIQYRRAASDFKPWNFMVMG